MFNQLNAITIPFDAPLNCDIQGLKISHVIDTLGIDLTINISPETLLTKPLLLTPSKSHDLYKIHIELGEGAEATIINFSAHDAPITCETHIKLSKNSRLLHIVAQEETTHPHRMFKIISTQENNSEFLSFCCDRGCQSAQFSSTVDLNGNARCNLSGLYKLTGEQKSDHRFHIKHHASDSHSNINYRGLANDISHGVFEARTTVAPHLEKITAHQNNKNLLLSSNAKIDTKPELEVYADDVECTHGATIGQLDEEALFYLQTRGIDFAMAQELLKKAFCSEPLKIIKNADIKKWLAGILS